MAIGTKAFKSFGKMVDDYLNRLQSRVKWRKEEITYPVPGKEKYDDEEEIENGDEDDMQTKNYVEGSRRWFVDLHKICPTMFIDIST
ncbi:hypothetical protein AVEN_17673-1 [Araneus ventricosus]|uniref:Uncharacterized protein n=1 Tax=Araneus ventricosus TaxID=182803 RepID=A0A4Y2Q324_ARAVE|nr:hypothetical protein AVEN_17673-1 [Araneus ventricosus]